MSVVLYDGMSTTSSSIALLACGGERWVEGYRVVLREIKKKKKTLTLSLQLKASP